MVLASCSAPECRRSICLNRPGKQRSPVDLFLPGHDPADPSRRDFLIRGCQGGSASLLSAGWIGLSRRFAHAFGFEEPHLSAGDFHLHPHYRAQLPLDAMLPKTQAGLDNFVTEKYKDQIALVLRDWSKNFLASSQDTRAVERVLASEFL